MSSQFDTNLSISTLQASLQCFVLRRLFTQIGNTFIFDSSPLAANIISWQQKNPIHLSTLDTTPPHAATILFSLLIIIPTYRWSLVQQPIVFDVPPAFCTAYLSGGRWYLMDVCLSCSAYRARSTSQLLLKYCWTQ